MDDKPLNHWQKAVILLLFAIIGWALVAVAVLILLGIYLLLQAMFFA